MCEITGNNEAAPFAPPRYITRPVDDTAVRRQGLQDVAYEMGRLMPFRLGIDRLVATGKVTVEDGKLILNLRQIQTGELRAVLRAVIDHLLPDDEKRETHTVATADAVEVTAYLPDMTCGTHSFDFFGSGVAYK